MAHPYYSHRQSVTSKKRVKDLGVKGAKSESRYARGGKVKPSININIVNPSGGESASRPTPVPVPVPTPIGPPGGGGPPPGPPGGGGPPPPPMGVPPMSQPPPIMKRGGRIKMTAGSRSGKGRVQKASAARKAGLKPLKGS